MRDALIEQPGVWFRLGAEGGWTRSGKATLVNQMRNGKGPYKGRVWECTANLEAGGYTVWARYLRQA